MVLRSDPGGTADPDHFYYGGGRGGASLGLDGREGIGSPRGM